MSLDESITKMIISISAVVLLAATSVQSMPVVFAQECVEIAVSGTLMRGLQLEPNLVNLGAPPVVGGAPPVVGGAPPVVGGAPPVVGGAPPVVGGAPPVVGGAPPVVGGAPPVVGGAPPVVGGAPPVVGGAPPVVGGGQQQLQPLVAPQGSTFIKEDRTRPEYRLYSINDVNSAMVRVPANATNGVSVVVELWCVPADGVATLLEHEPPGLSIGKARLMDDSTVLGVIAEPALLVGMKDISNFDGNWREYIVQTGMELIDKATQSANLTSGQINNATQSANLTSGQINNATQSANLTSGQIAAIQQLRNEGELLAQNGQLRGAIDSLNTAIKMLGLKDRLYLNIPLGYGAP